jgi:hypothetical protein
MVTIEHSKQQTMSAEKEIETTECNCIFGKISRFFCRMSKKVPLDDTPSELFLIRHDISYTSLPQYLLDYISQCQWLGLKVIVKELPSQIECEGIGYHLCFEGKQLESQACLQLQVEYVEKKTVFFQPLDLSTPKIDENLVYNLLNQT